MSSISSKLSNPYSTGGGGFRFESHVQASFLALLLTGGQPPCLPFSKVTKLKLQGHYEGYQTDDLIVFSKNNDNQIEYKLLGQVKHTIKITQSDKTFSDVIQAAWNDFNNPTLFNKEKDVIALITGPLSTTDTNDVRALLEWARNTINAEEFFRKVKLANFSSNSKRTKLSAFRSNLKKANSGVDVNDDITFEFLKHFHLLGYDLDIKTGVNLSLLHSLIAQFTSTEVQLIWAKLVDEIQSANQNAGSLNQNNISQDLLDYFPQQIENKIPDKFIVPSTPNPTVHINTFELKKSLTLASLLGKWDENNEADKDIISRLIDGV